MNKLFKVILVLLFLIQPALSQEVQTIEFLAKARDSFQSKDYKRAIEYFEKVVSDDSISDEVRSESYLKLAQSYENREEFRDSAYFYGEFVRTTEMNHSEFSTALYKAGNMNFEISHPKKDQGYSDMAIFYLTNFLELYPSSPLANEAVEKIELSREKIAEYHYDQFGTYYFRHDNFCGAFIAFEDSLASSQKFKEEILRFTKECKNSRSCSEEVVECSTRFNLSNIESLGIFNFTIN